MKTLRERAPVFQYYVVRANRGKARIWLEGNRISHAGLSVGDRFDLDIIAGQHLRIKKAEDGAHKVSGKGERPIIDLSGSSCAPFSTGDAVALEYHPHGTIYVKPDEHAAKRYGGES